MNAAAEPFVGRYPERTSSMEFLGGFVGVVDRRVVGDAETLALCPEVGRAVRESGAAD